MPRSKTIPDEKIKTIARTLFLKNGINTSTRNIAKAVGISEAVIYQRFGTKEDFFFAAMELPKTELDAIFCIQTGEGKVLENLIFMGLQIVDYFREAMPVFLTLISHPSFDMQIFLEQHNLPGMQLSKKLIDYLVEESKLGRVSQNNFVVVVEVLLSHLHNIALYEAIGAPKTNIDNRITEAVGFVWNGLAP